MTLASWITSIRFLLVPLIYWQMTAGSQQGVVISFILLLTAAATDIADGWVARARREISELGKTLDPLADKLVILFTMVALVVRWAFPLWIVLAYLVKEIIQITAGAVLLRKYRQLIPANGWGKAATVLFFIGFGSYFIKPWIGIGVIAVAVLVSIYALYTYVLDFIKLKNQR